MKVSKRYVAWLALVLLGAAPVGAQDDACRGRSLMVSVIDAKGNPVPGLGRADFAAKFRGKPVNITFVEPDTSTRHIVILLDASGRMLSDRRKAVLDAVDDLLTKAPAQIPIALSVFSGKVESSVTFSQNRAAISSELSALRLERKAMLKGPHHSALWDGVLDALGMFGTPRLGDVIYAITDGEDNERDGDHRRVEEALLLSGVRLFVCLSLPDNSPLTAEGALDLLEAVGVTGGSLATSGGLKSNLQLPPGPALDVLYRRMTVFYRLDVELPEAVDKPRDRDLKLEVQGKNKKGWNLVYPRKLMPCAAATR
jgi:hypothetical protein